MELYLKIWPFGNLFGARQAILHFDLLSLACLANKNKELYITRQSGDKNGQNFSLFMLYCKLTKIVGTNHSRWTNLSISENLL